jgi:hypothetical protein
MQPGLAAEPTLLTTGDGRIRYTGLDSPYWISNGDDGGRNWTGRLLERAGTPLRLRGRTRPGRRNPLSGA